jgi:hypothetical protein
VLLEFDKLRTFVRSGYAEPAYGWSTECERQWSLARDVVGAAVPVYAAQSVAIVEAYANTGDFDRWQAAFGSIPVSTFVLLPPLDLVLARNRQRRGAARLTDNDLRSNYNAPRWTGRRGNGVIILRIADEPPEVLAQRLIDRALPAAGW